MPPPGSFFLRCMEHFWSQRSDFCNSCFFNLLEGFLKVSSVCDIWFVWYDLVLEVMSRPKWPVCLILCKLRVCCITDAALVLYFVNSTSLVSQSVIRRYSRVNFRSQGQLRSINGLPFQAAGDGGISDGWPSVTLYMKKILSCAWSQCVCLVKTHWMICSMTYHPSHRVTMT